MLVDLTRESRLIQLRELLEIIAAAIDDKPGARDLAGLSRQYRETLREIEELEGEEDNSDEIGQIIAARSDGEPKPNRKNRA